MPADTEIAIDPTNRHRRAWAATTPSLLVKSGYFTNPNWWGRSFDISLDGRRFLVIKEVGIDGIAATPSIIVVLNWFEELKRLVLGRK